MPETMRGRVLGITGAIGWGSVPLGRLLVGAGLAWFGLTPTLAGLAILFLPVPLILFAAPAFRDLRALAADERTA